MARESIKPLYVSTRRSYRNLRHNLRELFRDAPPLAHHGIQRSGTNYLSALLTGAGINVVNEVDPVRNSPRHKHCRWQDDKSTIRMDLAYLNDYAVEDIEQINALCGYPVGQQHIVIFKEPHAWIQSIARWADRTAWESADSDHSGDSRPGSVALAWAKEWDAYYAKWFALHDRSPHQIAIVEYGELVRRPELHIGMLRSFTGVERLSLKDGGRVRRVPHSPSHRETTDADTRLGAAIDAVVTIDWQRFSRET